LQDLTLTELIVPVAWVQEVYFLDIITATRNKHITNQRISPIIFITTLFLLFEKINFNVAITEMYPRIPCEPRSTLWEPLL